jgi:hypothetical protein
MKISISANRVCSPHIKTSLKKVIYSSEKFFYRALPIAALPLSTELIIQIPKRRGNSAIPELAAACN